MTKNDAVERAVEALRVAKNVEAAFHEFSDSPQDAIAIVGEILGRWNSCFADELQALQTSRPDAESEEWQRARTLIDVWIEGFKTRKPDGYPMECQWAWKYLKENAETIRAALKSGEMNDEQIKYMRDRFLGWKLPEDFYPDGGISFKKTFNDHLPQPMKHEPSGTNLFDAQQAEAMIRYMIEGMP